MKLWIDNSPFQSWIYDPFEEFDEPEITTALKQLNLLEDYDSPTSSRSEAGDLSGTESAGSPSDIPESPGE